MPPQFMNIILIFFSSFIAAHLKPFARSRTQLNWKNLIVYDFLCLSGRKSGISFISLFTTTATCLIIIIFFFRSLELNKEIFYLDNFRINEGNFEYWRKYLDLWLAVSNMWEWLSGWGRKACCHILYNDEIYFEWNHFCTICRIQ